MNRPYIVYRNGLVWRKRKSMQFAIKDMKELREQGFQASIAEDISGGN